MSRSHRSAIVACDAHLAFPDPELPGNPPEHPAPVMVPAEVAYALCFDEWGRPWRDSVWDLAAALLAEQLAAQLERASFVVMRKARQSPHGTGQSQRRG